MNERTDTDGCPVCGAAPGEPCRTLSAPAPLVSLEVSTVDGWVSDRDYYLDADGELTSDESEANVVIARAGAFLLATDAERYGIVRPSAVKSQAEYVAEQNAAAVATHTGGALATATRAAPVREVVNTRAARGEKALARSRNKARAGAEGKAPESTGGAGEDGEPTGEGNPDAE